MKYVPMRHVHFEPENGQGIAICTCEPLEKVIRDVMNPARWKNGRVPEFTRIWVEWW